MTEVTSNVSTATVLLPIVGALAVALHQHPLLLMLPVTLSASNAFMLPVATPPNAVAFATGYVKLIEMAHAGTLLDVVGVVLTAVWTLAFGRVIFDYKLDHVPDWTDSAR